MVTVFQPFPLKIIHPAPENHLQSSHPAAFVLHCMVFTHYLPSELGQVTFQ